jgi:pyroglutamyl-peptidase
MSEVTPAERILLTVFEPFGGSDVNASLEAGYLLAQTDERIQLVTLPVVRYRAGEIALSHLERRITASHLPSLMVSLGEAGPEMVIRLEKVAINWDDYRIPDNAGNQPHDATICSGSPAAYFATLPVARIAEHLTGKTPVPVVVSLSAGAYLCNHTAFTVLDYLHRTPLCPYTFIHVPSWRPTAGREPLYQIMETLRLILNEALRQR